MALILLQVLVLGVIAAAVDDVPVRWVSPAAQLECRAGAAPRPPPPPLDDTRPRSRPYFWRRDGENLKSKRVSLNGMLEVSRKRDRSAVYQCGVNSHAGVVLGNPMHLKFASMSKQFSKQPENTTVQRGQPAALSCIITSEPPALISWLKNGEPLPRHSRYHILDSQLLITDVTQEDAATYKCIATNVPANRTRVSQSGSLQVLETAQELEAGMLQVYSATQIAAPRGTYVILPCPVVGWPRPKLLWTLTPPDGERTSELEAVDEVLVLRSLELDQEGLYSCSVEGQPHLTKSFNVTVSEPASVSLVPTSKEVLRASTVRFNCSATGRPKPVISWYKDGQPLPLAGRINLRTSPDSSMVQLVISGVTSDDAGVYQCFAHSGGGGQVSWASAWGTLNITGVSAAAPGALRCLPAGTRRVALRWRPAAAKVVAYTVDSTPKDKPGTVLTGQPHNNTEQVVTLKEPLTPYYFQVRAYIPTADKKNVASDMSASVVCQGQGVPIKLSRVEGGVVVSWRKFAAENPGVVQWVLQHKADNDTHEHNVTLPGERTNYTLPAGPTAAWTRVLGSRTADWMQQDLSLLPWTAAASADQTPFSDVAAVPQNVRVSDVGLYGFTVRWICTEADTSPERYSFRVCVRKVNGAEECQESYKKSKAEVEGLDPGSEYEVRVQAVMPGRALGGAFSDPVRVTTQPDGPWHVGNLTYAFVNSSAVRVRWRGAALRYTVRYSARLRLPVEQWAAVTTGDTTALITGIDPVEQTYVMVTGHEPLGHSHILTIPAQVKDLEAKELSYTYTRSGVRVWWGEPGARVVLYAQNITRPVEHWTRLNVTEPHVELDNLDPLRPVYVMVTLPGPGKPNQVLTISPRAVDNYNLYLSIGVFVGVGVLCAVFIATACIWKKYKQNRSRVRTRRRNHSVTEGIEEVCSEMTSVVPGSAVGGRLANGGACVEPLLNGHLHPLHHSKTPNGKLKKGLLYEVFDVSRDEADVTVETVLDDTLPAYFLDTSRRPEFESRQELVVDCSIHKLPDDNMNSELNRSTEFPLDNSKIQPTLQPNG